VFIPDNSGFIYLSDKEDMGYRGGAYKVEKGISSDGRATQVIVTALDGEPIAMVNASPMWSGRVLKNEVSRYVSKGRRIEQLLYDAHIIRDDQTLQDFLGESNSSASAATTLTAILSPLVPPGTYGEIYDRYDSGEDHWGNYETIDYFWTVVVYQASDLLKFELTLGTVDDRRDESISDPRVGYIENSPLGPVFIFEKEEYSKRYHLNAAEGKDKNVKVSLTFNSL
jgi:hypothetical protein